MAKTSAEKMRDYRLRKRKREFGGRIEMDILTSVSDAMIDASARTGKSEREVVEHAILLYDMLTKEGNDMLTCWTLDELHNQKMLERQTRLSKRDKATMKGDGKVDEDDASVRIAQELIDLIRSEQPNFMGGAKISARHWSRSIRAMIEVDFRDPAEMSAILKYVGEHDRFNIRTILGPRKFREQYDRLAITYNDWVKKGAGVNKLTSKRGQKGDVNPVNVKSAETILLEQKTAAALEKMRRIEAERAKKAKLTGLSAEPGIADTGSIDAESVTPFQCQNPRAVQSVKDFLGKFELSGNAQSNN